VTVKPPPEPSAANPLVKKSLKTLTKTLKYLILVVITTQVPMHANVPAFLLFSRSKQLK